MKLQIPKKYIKYKDTGVYIIAAPAGVPELARYVMRIPQRLVTGRGPTILVRHGNEKDANGKTCHYRLDKEPDVTGDPSQPHRYTTTELQALYDRAELICPQAPPQTGPGLLVKAAYAAPVPGTRLKRRTEAWFVMRDQDDVWAYDLSNALLQGHPVKDIEILEEYRIRDISALLAVGRKLPTRLSPDDIASLGLIDTRTAGDSM